MRRPIPEYKRMNINSVHRFVLGGKFIYIVSRSIVSNYNDTNNAEETSGLNHAIRLHSLSMHGMDARCRVCKDPFFGAQFETRRGRGLRGLRSNNMSSFPHLSRHISIELVDFTPPTMLVSGGDVRIFHTNDRRIFCFNK